MLQKIHSRITPELWQEAWTGPFTCPQVGSPQSQVGSRQSIVDQRNLPHAQGGTRDIGQRCSSMLTADQLRVFEELKNGEKGVHMVIGSPGTSKVS